ncbi:contactin-5-like [Uloborus diversus]|uniref:contactin-5-like n=1 Tax=Uloborus diversus TaxID=327109 RepID=UPI00240954B4|nr:contactin-5-like [Uloborus diversus]
MILSWMFLLWLKMDLCAPEPKAGIPGIKIRPVSDLEETIEYPEIYAVVGSTVFLPCNMSQPSQDDVISLVLWYRIDLPNPIYTLDTRGADGAKHFAGKSLGTRAFFNISRRSSAHLRLEPVDELDEGEYRCRIDFKRGRTLNRLVKLNVIVPVKKVLIRGRGNITYSGVIGPFTEGEKLVLICEAFGGRPRPYIIWRRGHNIIQGTITVDDQGGIRNELVFERLRREHLMNVLICQSSNNNVTTPLYSMVTIDLNLKPLSVQITMVPKTLTVGENLELNCQSEGSKPPAQVSWTKASENVDHLAIQNIYGSISVSTLSFVITAEDNGKKLVCRAKNPHLTESALEDSLILNVQYPPHLTLVFGASVQFEHIREGSDVYFECNIQANPPISEVQWKFQHRNLAHDPRSGITIKNHSLLLHNVSRRNRGLYQCVAFNARGKGESEEVTLRIQHSPVCSPKQPRTYNISHHGKNNVSCAVEADPKAVTFSWMLNNSVAISLRNAVLLETDSGSTSVIEYHPVTKLDYGALHCHAKNSIGTMKEPCVFNIVPIEIPQSLLNCTVFNQTKHTLIVSCDFVDTSKQQTFHLEVYDTKGERLMANLSTSEEPYFYVRNLPGGSTFILALYTSGLKGRSETVALTASTSVPSERQSGSENRNFIGAVILVAIAASGALVLLIVAGVLAIVKNKTGSSHEASAGTEMNEKTQQSTPKSSKQSFEDGNSYIYHTAEVPTEYVHLTPKSTPDCLYKSLMEGSHNTYEDALKKAHAMSEEGIEVILPVIER